MEQRCTLTLRHLPQIRLRNLPGHRLRPVPNLLVTNVLEVLGRLETSKVFSYKSPQVVITRSIDPISKLDER